jgi:hypothetical protein
MIKIILYTLFFLTVSGCANQKEYARNHIKRKIYEHQQTKKKMKEIGKNTDWAALGQATVKTNSQTKADYNRQQRVSTHKDSQFNKSRNKSRRLINNYSSPMSSQQSQSNTHKCYGMAGVKNKTGSVAQVEVQACSIVLDIKDNKKKESCTQRYFSITEHDTELKCHCTGHGGICNTIKEAYDLLTRLYEDSNGIYYKSWNLIY